MRLIAHFKKSNHDQARAVREILVEDAISELMQNYQTKVGDMIHQQIDAYILSLIDEDPQKIKTIPKQFSFSFKSFRDFQEDPFEEAKEQDNEVEEQEHNTSIKPDQAPVETEQEQMLNESVEPTMVMTGSPIKKRVALHDNFITDFLNSDL